MRRCHLKYYHSSIRSRCNGDVTGDCLRSGAWHPQLVKRMVQRLEADKQHWSLVK
jgi:hypothetical protein